MKRLRSGPAKFYAIIIFAITVIVSFMLPGYTVTAGGLLLGIFLTIFIRSKAAPVIAGVINILIILFSVFFIENDMVRLYLIARPILRVLSVTAAAPVLVYIR